MRKALFCDQPAVFAHVIEADDEGIVGIAIWFLTYSTWTGVHGIWLEDLFVEQSHRGKGYGKALLRSVANEAVSRGFKRLEWSVLTWNQPSIDVYESLGAVRQEKWRTYRLTDDPLTSLAVGRR